MLSGVSRRMPNGAKKLTSGWKVVGYWVEPMTGLAENPEMFGRKLARLNVWLKNCGWAIGTTDELVLMGWFWRASGLMPPNEALFTCANDGAAKPRATTTPASHFQWRMISPFSPHGDCSVRRERDVTR